jgi:hypothetical protein
VYRPCFVGVPARAPVAAVRVIPGGRRAGDDGPGVRGDATRGRERGRVGSAHDAVGRVAVVTASVVDGRTWIESACVSLRAGVPESSARTVKAYVPGVVGVPATAPVVLERARPGGRLPAASDQAYGVLPPDAATVCEYACPTVPPGRLVVVIWSGSRTSIVSACVSV